MSIYDVLQGAVPQLKNIGSFNPAKLDPVWKDWLMRAERVYIDTYAGDFRAFFGAIASIHQNATKQGGNTDLAIKNWIMDEIAALKRAEKKH